MRKKKTYPSDGTLRRLFPECWRQADLDYAVSDAQGKWDEVEEELRRFFKENPKP